MKRILVTGSTGFIGRHTLKILAESGHEISTLGSVNLFDAQGIKSLIQDIKPTHLLHLAWLTTPGVFFESPDNLKWVEATLNLVRCFSEFGGKRFVGAGTCSEILLPDSLLTFYGFCKDSTRLLLEKYCKKVGVGFAWGRIYFLYGPYERPERLVPTVIKGVLKGESVACSAGDQIRDYLYVEDCAQCFVDLVNGDKTGIFEVASGHPIQLREFILAFAQALGRPELIKFGARPEISGEPKVLFSKNAFMKPATSLEQGIQKSIDYWRQEIL